MIHRISKRIVNFLLFSNVINKEEIDVYIYGYEMILSSLIDFMIVLITSILFNEFIYMTSFFVMFVSTRLYTGGYHADTFLKCKLVFITLCLIMVGLSEIALNLSIVIPSLIMFIVTAYHLSPVENKNKIISKEMKIKYRNISVILSIIWSITAIITYFSFIKICQSIVFTALIITVLMIVGENKQRKEEKLNEN